MLSDSPSVSTTTIFKSKSHASVTSSLIDCLPADDVVRARIRDANMRKLQGDQSEYRRHVCPLSSKEPRPPNKNSKQSICEKFLQRRRSARRKFLKVQQLEGRRGRADIIIRWAMTLCASIGHSSLRLLGIPQTSSTWLKALHPLVHHLSKLLIHYLFIYLQLIYSGVQDTLFVFTGRFSVFHLHWVTPI